MKTVGTLVPQHIPAIAAKLLGRPDLSRSDIGRIALRVYKGADPFEALKDEASTISGHGGVLNFRVADELADVGAGVNRSAAIRTGLAIIMGMSPEEAETWARMPVGRPKGSRDSYRRTRGANTVST